MVQSVRLGWVNMRVGTITTSVLLSSLYTNSTKKYNLPNDSSLIIKVIILPIVSIVVPVFGVIL